MIENRIVIGEERNIAQGGAWVSHAAGLNRKKPRMLAACRLELNDSLK